MILDTWKAKINSIVFKNYLYLLMIQGANFILPLITIPYLVRTIGTHKFGIVMVAQSLALFLTIVTDFGFNISATREVAMIKNNKESLSQFFFNVIFIKTILLICSFLVLLSLTIFVEKFNQESLVYLLSFGIVFGQVLFPSWFFQGIEKMKMITLINVLAKLIFTVSVFLVIKNQDDYYFVPLFYGLGFLLSGALGFIFSLKYIQYKKPIVIESIQIAKESFSLFLSNLAVSLYTNMNTFIIGVFVSDSLAGVYSSMEKLIVATKSIYTPLYQAMFPNLSIKGKHKIKETIEYMKYYVGGLGIIISLVIILFAKDILEIIYKDDLITSYYSIFQILGLIGFLSSLNMLYVSLFFPAVKAFNDRLKILSFAGLFNVFMVLLLIQFYTIYGVAISATISEFFILILAIYFYKKHVKKELL